MDQILGQLFQRLILNRVKRRREFLLTNVSDDGIEDLKRQRNKVATPQALSDICVKVVIENQSYFQSQPLNPFRNLPNHLAQKFITSLFVAKDAASRLTPPEEEKERNFAFLFLNAHVTEFKFFEYCSEEDEMVVYLKHLLNNCPEITKIVKIGIIDMMSQYSTPNVMVAANKWPNLKHFCMQGYVCTDEVLSLIQKYLPNLESLMFTLGKKTFSNVESLSKLLKLEHLHINTTHLPNFSQKVLAHAAGKIPNLKELHLVHAGEPYNNRSTSLEKLLEVYGKNYPSKKLIVSHIRLKNLTQNWPPCLHAEHLTLAELKPFNSVEKIALIPNPVKYVTLLTVPIKQIYKILSKLGPEIINLKIVSVPTDFETNFREPLDLFRVIEACPKVETLEVESINPLTGYEKLTPQHFADYRKFECSLNMKYNIEARDSLLKLFLFGSQVYNKKLTLSDNFDYVLEALQENPTCLNKLQELEFRLADDADRDDVDTAVEIAIRMIHRSPHLKKIHFDCMGFWDCDSDDSNFELGDDIKTYIHSTHEDTFIKFVSRVGVNLKFSAAPEF